MLHTDISTSEFIQQHLLDDPAKLLLKAAKYPDFDIPFIADQILARKQIKDKLPEWYANSRVILPARIAAEQCSSSLTAIYKQRLIKGDTVCDLTGGLGVDTFYISKVTRKSFYIERFTKYCEAARHNFEQLGALHIEVINGDSRMANLPEVDTIYLDPARRSDANKRIFDISECEPDLLVLKDDLFKKAPRIVVKISPMADITRTLSLLPETSEIHVISVKNECKEVVFVLDKMMNEHNPMIYCVNLQTDGTENIFKLRQKEELENIAIFAKETERYLYEPNTSVLKAGAFCSISTRFGVKKLHPNSHLYTSDILIPDFPGRIFEVKQIIDFSSKIIKKISDTIPKANITVRNFPLTVEEIRKKTKIKEGGDRYIFATITGKDTKILIEGIKAL